MDVNIDFGGLNETCYFAFFFLELRVFFVYVSSALSRKSKTNAVYMLLMFFSHINSLFSPHESMTACYRKLYARL